MSGPNLGHNKKTLGVQYFTIDVPRPLINDLRVFLSQKIEAECVKLASRAGTSVYVKVFNKCK